jgi:hypothetical protein
MYFIADLPVRGKFATLIDVRARQKQSFRLDVKPRVAAEQMES